MGTTVSDWSDVDTAAREMVGNWQKFQSFGWHDKPEEAGEFCLVYTHHRDSGVLDRSNAEVISKTLEPFTEGEEDERDVWAERHNHWAVGWIEGFCIRVFRKGAVTEAFRKYAELRERLEDYPILNEDLYGEMQHEEVLETIESCGKRFLKDGATEEWPSRVYEHMDDVFDPDDVREKDIIKLMKELGFYEE